MASGVRAKGRTAAAGMISNEMISSTPTIFMAMAITTANSTIKPRRTRMTGTPSARAISS